uniref:Mcf.2 cell line derived transforming sequence-like b n=1 Tax=Fundulus heteroclitus TaxID=8078 RepID=A0A3Q2UPM0_FUNHE
MCQHDRVCVFPARLTAVAPASETTVAVSSQAIEAFALMVKTVAQTLQAFGTELAETELPNDADATVHLLHEHTLKKDTMKVHEPIETSNIINISMNKQVNLFRHPVLFLFYSLCFRLLGQLDETETAFDDFWERHRTKLEQCLQLRHFEKHFREVSQVQSQETLSYLCLERFEGDRLIENSHYAEDCIRPKCSELRGVCEEIGSTLRSKKGLLLRALELHHALEKASQWCEEGIFLLANQPVDRCQSQDGAEAALQELERYLDTAALHTLTDRSAICCQYDAVLNPQLRVSGYLRVHYMLLHLRIYPNTKPAPEVKSPLSSPSKSSLDKYVPLIHLQIKLRHLLKPWLQPNSSQANLGQSQSFCVCALSVVPRHVMNELLETERVYVEELLCVLEGYAAEMDNPAMAHLIPSSLQNLNERYLQIYEAYCQNKPRSESLWRQCSDCAFFQECQKKLEHKLGLDSYLLKPVQRITKYQLLLKELLKYSKGCDGAADLQEALSSILGILKAVNDSMHLIAITGYEGNLSELGRLLMQGSFSVWTEHKKGHAKVKDLARFKPMQRHLFLHEKALLFCKRREENGEGYEKAPSYSFKHSLRMSAVGITENAKGDNKKFEIWCNSREEVFIVQVSSGLLKTPPVSLQNTQRGNNALLFLGPNRGDQNGMGERDPQSSDSAAQSLGEDPMNSDVEDEVEKKLAPGKYTVVADCEKAGPQELSVKSGDVVQLIREGDEGQWFVKNLRSGKDGWVAAANLLSLISESKSSQSLSSSGWSPTRETYALLVGCLFPVVTESVCPADGSVSGNLSTSSSCSETYTSFSDIKP